MTNVSQLVKFRDDRLNIERVIIKQRNSVWDSTRKVVHSGIKIGGVISLKIGGVIIVFLWI